MRIASGLFERISISILFAALLGEAACANPDSRDDVSDTPPVGQSSIPESTLRSNSLDDAVGSSRSSSRGENDGFISLPITTSFHLANEVARVVVVESERHYNTGSGAAPTEDISATLALAGAAGMQFDQIVVSVDLLYKGSGILDGFTLAEWGSNEAVDNPKMYGAGSTDIGVVFVRLFEPVFYSDPLGNNPDWVESLLDKATILSTGGNEYKAMTVLNWYEYNGEIATSIVNGETIFVSKLESILSGLTNP